MNEQLKKRLQARKKEMTDAKEIEINETHEQNQEKFEQELALRAVFIFWQNSNLILIALYLLGFGIGFDPYTNLIFISLFSPFVMQGY